MTDANVVTAYHLGRPLAAFEAPYLESDKAFATQRIDGAVIESANYRHCTFANLSFKEAKVKSGTFLDCVFIGCYFRRAELTDCRFVGCRFFDCNFSHIALKSCDFRFSIFHGCQIPFSEFEYSLPTEPNLREELTRNLSVESSRLGLSREARRYRMAEINAYEQHLLAAIWGSSRWYKEHFDVSGRITACFKWLLSLMNRWLWGYGERVVVLVRNLLLAFVVFAVLFYVFRDELSHPSGRPVSFLDSVYFSLDNVVPAGTVSEIVAGGSMTRILAGLESFFGVVAVALFAAYVFRWSLHR